MIGSKSLVIVAAVGLLSSLLTSVPSHGLELSEPSWPIEPRHDSPRTVPPKTAELVAEADAAAAPTLKWKQCREEGLENFECARARVPLDYARPDDAQLGLAVIRQRAADPDRRIGTLFTAVGGPGVSGLEQAKQTSRLADGRVAERFDVIAFDQRGIGQSSQVRCFASAADQRRFWADVRLPPVNPAEERLAEHDSRSHARGCAKHDGTLLSHLTTVDAARDLDLLRRAVGEERLTYSGGSYASYLGEVYGALLGERVRALALDSMIDPESYTNNTLAALWTRSSGTEETLREWARLCDKATVEGCALSGNALERNDSVLQELETGPITVGSGTDAIFVSYQDVIPLHANLLYNIERGWPGLASLVAELERGPDGDPAIVREILAASAFREDFLDSYTAISCADNEFPRLPELWPWLAAVFDSHAPTYGRHWLYALQACASWTSSADGYPQRYTGPWTLRSEEPALLLQNRFDPVTPVSDAYRALKRLENARLLVVKEGYGHGTTSHCINRVRENYLLNLELPAADTECTPDRPPFDSAK